MALPERVRVKISSEAAEYLALTPVLVSEIEIRQLLEMAVAAAGFDAERVRDLLSRGSLVSSASRFRWERLNCSAGDVQEALRTLPGPEPGRPCARDKCLRAVLSGPSTRIEIDKRVASARGWLRHRSFWDALMAEAAAPVYGGYLIGERADRYIADLDRAASGRLIQATALLPHAGLARLIRTGHVERLELIVERQARASAAP